MERKVELHLKKLIPADCHISTIKNIFSMSVVTEVTHNRASITSATTTTFDQQGH